MFHIITVDELNFIIEIREQFNIKTKDELFKTLEKLNNEDKYKSLSINTLIKRIRLLDNKDFKLLLLLGKKTI